MIRLGERNAMRARLAQLDLNVMSVLSNESLPLNSPLSSFIELRFRCIL